jgi:prolyl 4-hydroxylase
MTSHLPTDSDLVSAMLSLVRLQKTYDLPLSDLVAGRVAKMTSSPLDQQTVFDIALLCLGNGEPELAVDWLTHAHNYTSGPATVPLPALYQAFARAYAQKQDYLTAVDYIRKAVELDPTNAGYLSDILPPANVHVTLGGTPDWRRHYFRLCQQGTYTAEQQQQMAIVSDNSLHCRLVSSRTVPFQRHKVEFVHRSPDVVLFHDFVSDRESQRLRDMAADKIVRAKVGSTIDSVVSESRVGKIAWFRDDDSEILVRQISRRAADVTELNMTYPTCEPLQMSNYGLGGHYEPHYDHDEHRFERTDKPPELEEHGDRMATFMIYLNDVKVGGATVFPKLNLTAKPVKNAAIFWYNYKRNGTMDPLSLHAACPVLIGEKWVANKWIREYGQEFNRPCALDQNA